MNYLQTSILLSTFTVFFYDTVSLYLSLYIKQISFMTILMPVLGFHTIALIINFIHWFLDTWTSKNNNIRKRFFNQAKGHHYYPHLVVKKEFFARNDDVIYGSLVFGIIFAVFHSRWSLNTQIYFHSLIWSTFISLEIHRHAHMKIEDVPYVVRLLQNTGIILSRESHYQHHNGKFEGSYDLMSGLMNRLTDFTRIYPFLEYVVEKSLGIKPRSYLKDKDQKSEFKEYYESHTNL